MKLAIKVFVVFIAISNLLGCSSGSQPNQKREIIDCLYTESFDIATTSIKLNQSEMNNLAFAGDWVQGKYYDFSYRANKGTVYCDSKGEVESFNFSDVRVFLKGFEPLNVDDYLVNTIKADELQSDAIQRVKMELTFPNEAVFQTHSFGFARWVNLYGVSGNVKAKNALGIEAEVKFSLIFDVSNNNRLVYFTLGGSRIFGERPNFEPIRKEIFNNDSDGILIIDGIKGTYGKDVLLDGYSYIWYMIPQGKYEIICESKACIVFLDKDKTIKNREGYIETVNVITIRFNELDGTKELTISKDQHIELGIGSKVRFREIE